jgi:pimeloyl-ACP methyl ester carboxylesterase
MVQAVQMTNTQLRDIGSLAGDALGGGVALVEGIHRAVAARSFPPGAAKHTHDVISGSVYGVVGLAHRLVPRAIGRAAAAVVKPGFSVDASPIGNVATAVVNGVCGDHLAANGNSLTINMAVRRDGADVALDPASFADVGSKLAVFVHGLCETELAWQPSLRRQRHDGAFHFGERMAADGWTPLMLRYNTGRSIVDNGAALASLLDRLTAVWPTPITSIALLGHSMGGLVIRSACEQGSTWTDAVRHVICLGTPHLGAPLAQAANSVARLLDVVPETRGVAAVLDGRSTGIKDLALGLDAASLSHANHVFVGVTVTHDAHHPLGRLVGDLLVLHPSATARSRTREVTFDIGSRHHLGGLDHLDLLSHPDVYAAMVGAMAEQ